MGAIVQKLEELGEVIETDVLVIGAGIGGCCSAITARESGADDVVIVEKSHAGRTGPSALVGGIFNLEDELKFETEFLDYVADQKVFEVLLQLVPEIPRNLEKWGVRFVKKADGTYVTLFQRGNNTIRLDGGGIPMMDALTSYAKKVGIKIVNWSMITDLLVSEGRVVGAVGINCRTGEFLIFRSKAVILATGGTIFKSRQPGHRNTTGDGFAAAYRAGADIAGFDFSWSNVYGATLEVGPGNGLMLSLGARLLNNKMEEYAKNYPEITKLLSPEWHAPLMAMEAKRGNAPPIWLDLRHFTEEQVEAIYRSVPYAAKRWERLGFLIGKRFVKLCEYAPEGPRRLGGLFVNSEFESRNIRNLFGCGESCPSFQTRSGLHLAAASGMLAGNSAAKRASAIEIGAVDRDVVESLKNAVIAPIVRKDGIDPENALSALQEAIHPYTVHILRNETAMKKALLEVERIRDTVIPYMRAYDPHYLRFVHEIRNMVLCAEMFLKSALLRRESRLGGLREDYPQVDNVNWLKWIFVKQDHEAGRMRTWTEDVPIETYKFKPRREKFLHPFWSRVQELGYWKPTGGQGNGC